jgi:hypothetical protein
MSTKKPKTHYIYQMINGNRAYVPPGSPYYTVRPPRSVREGTKLHEGDFVYYTEEGLEAHPTLSLLKGRVGFVYWTDDVNSTVHFPDPSRVRRSVTVETENKYLKRTRRK